MYLLFFTFNNNSFNFNEVIILDNSSLRMSLMVRFAELLITKISEADHSEKCSLILTLAMNYE